MVDKYNLICYLVWQFNYAFMAFGESKHRCKVDDQPIKHLAKRVDDLGNVFNDFDGANTDLGPVCEVCAPAYVDARTELWLDPSVNNLRKAVKAKLKDAAFVNVALRKHAQRVVDEILEDLDVGQFSKATVLQLRSFLGRCINFDDFGDRSGVHGGIDLSGTIQCFNEEERTLKYFQALFMRLDELTKEKPGQTLEMVDAGTGPFALFAAMAALKYDNVNVKALELNPVSAEVARRVVRNLGVADRVKIVEADATTYKHDSEVDLLVTETAFSGLLQEPIVQIMANFEEQMAEKSYMIPEWFTVDAGLVSTRAKEFWVPSNFALGPVEVVRMQRGFFADRIHFVLDTENLTAGDYKLGLSSRFGLAPGIILSGVDSNITKPVFAEDNVNRVVGNSAVEVEYLTGSQRGDVKAVVSLHSSDF